MRPAKRRSLLTNSPVHTKLERKVGSIREVRLRYKARYGPILDASINIQFNVGNESVF